MRAILGLLYRRRGKEKEQITTEDRVDFSNVVNSSFNAEPLYRTLIRACHPDRFAGDPKRIALATDLTARIGKYRHDIQRLLELQKEAEEKLKVNILK